MKRISIFFASILISIGCYSQIQTEVKDNVPIILPTLENFISLCDCSESEFVSYMKMYNYSEKNSSAQWISYNASLDHYMVHAVVDFEYAYGGNSIIAWLNKSEMYPSTAMSDIYRKLRPHYIRTEDQTENFAFNHKGKAYGVMVQNIDIAYVIRVINFGHADSRLSEL